VVRRETGEWKLRKMDIRIWELLRELLKLGNGDEEVDYPEIDGAGHEDLNIYEK